ncbi:MAG: hypothetical protein ABI209_00835 [Edaphobacter sp.]
MIYNRKASGSGLRLRSNRSPSWMVRSAPQFFLTLNHIGEIENIEIENVEPR